MNNVAMTVHKLMGDTFDKLATSISATDSSYALWMTSQVFVIESGEATEKSHACRKQVSYVGRIRLIFETRDLREERLFRLLDQIRNNSRFGSIVQPIDVSQMSYVPFNKNIPRSPTGFVYLLTSLNPTSPETFTLAKQSAPC